MSYWKYGSIGSLWVVIDKSCETIWPTRQGWLDVAIWAALLVFFLAMWARSDIKRVRT